MKWDEAETRFGTGVWTCEYTNINLSAKLCGQNLLEILELTLQASIRKDLLEEWKRQRRMEGKHKILATPAKTQ
jgi:hypothetical protein